MKLRFNSSTQTTPKVTLQERMNQGETNLAIKHINGIPTIVPIQSQTSEASQI